jgi:SWI/SNF-related matrix-associated actin-dependent regulator 1 of chromatin subfamily A
MNGHIASNHGLHVSFRQARGGDDSLHEEMTDEGPPRKRTNYGPSDSSFTSPSSPEVQRLGQRRRKVNDADGLSTSSEDSISDIHRLARGRHLDSHASPSADSLQTESEDHNFTRFLVTMPLHSPSLVRMAWQQAYGDVKKATILLSDPSWNPKPLTTVDLPSEGIGRVKEIDEATKAERAAAREKGKKSMIYANRSTMEDRSVLATTPPPTIPSIDLHASSPVTPIITQSRQKRSMKMIVGSESEQELTDGDERDDNKTDNSSLTRTLDYFNAADSEALQELMGISCLHDEFVRP